MSHFVRDKRNSLELPENSIWRLLSQQSPLVDERTERAIVAIVI
jgi:hypothetical protein